MPDPERDGDDGNDGDGNDDSRRAPPYSFSSSFVPPKNGVTPMTGCALARDFRVQ